MKRLTLFIAFLLLSSLTNAQLKSDNTIGVNGGIFWITGESSSFFDLGYTAGINYEFRFSGNFALEIAPFAAYVYGEDEPIFYGWYVDNYIYGISVIPKIIFPVGKGALQIVLAPKLSYSYVSTDLEIWLSSFASPFGETITKSSNSKGMFSIGALGGIEYAVNDNFAFGLNLYYDNLNLNKNIEEFNGANGFDGSLKPKINTSRMGLNLELKFGI